MINKLLSQGIPRRRGSLVQMLTNASWLTTARLAGDFASFLFFIILSRSFGPAGIGQYAYGFAIAGISYAAVNLGLEDYAIRECVRLPLEDRRILLDRLIGTQSGLAAIVLLGLLGVLYVTRNSVETITIILLLSIYQLTLAFARTFFAPAFAQESMTSPAIAELICRVGSIVFAFVLVSSFNTSLARTLIPFPIGGFVLLVISAISARHHQGNLSIRFSWQDATSIIRSTWPFAASVFVFHVYSRMDVVILSMVLGDNAAGIFASSLKFLEVGVIPLVFLGIALYPVLSRAFEEKEGNLPRAAERLLRISLLLGGLIAWGLVFLAPLVLVPLLGEDFTASAPVVKVMALLALGMALEMVAVRLLLATHLQIQRIAIQFWLTVVKIFLVLALIPLFGIFGAVIASIIAQVVMILLYIRVLRGKKVLPDSFVGIVASFLAPLSVSLLAGAVSAWLNVTQWLPAAASLATYGAMVLGTGFVPMPMLKTEKRRCTIDSHSSKIQGS